MRQEWIGNVKSVRTLWQQDRNRRKILWQHAFAPWLLVLSTVLVFKCVHADEAPIVIREQLGHDWQDELVHWPLPDAGRAWHLVDAQGTSLPCQRYDVKALVETPLNGPGLYAQIDLAAHATLTLQMKPGAPVDTSARVRVEQHPEGIVLANELLAVRLAQPSDTIDPKRVPSPIQSVRLTGEPWMGQGIIENAGQVTSLQVKILAEGPLFAEAEVTYTWDAKDLYKPWTSPRTYRARIRVVAGQSVIHVTEKFNIGNDARKTFRFTGLPVPNTWNGEWIKMPDHMIEIHSQPLTASTTLPLIPAWTWYANKHHRVSAWFAAWNSEREQPVVGALTTFPQDWSKKNLADRKQAMKMAPQGIGVSVDDEGLIALSVPLDNIGTHTYAIYLASRDRYLSAKPSGIAVAKRRASDLPLQRVKDWVLDWPEKTPHPHLFFDRDELPALRQQLATDPACAELVAVAPDPPKFLEDLTLHYLATNDKTVLPRLLHCPEPVTEARMGMQSKGLLWQLRARVHEMVEGNGINPAGINNMMWLPDHLMFRVITADVLLGDETVTQAEKEEIRRLFTILAYQMNRPEMVPDRDTGYQIGMPNFINAYYGTLGMIGAMFPGHPESETWMKRCRDEMLANIAWQSRLDGAWYESYYYQERTMRALVPAAIALARAGMQDILTHPLVLAAFRGQIAQLTPVDPRVGKRCYPPIGDGTYFVPKLNVGWAATTVAKTNPKLGGEMLWSWNQQGRPTQWLGLSSAVDPYGFVLTDHMVQEHVPALGSMVFSGAAVILRSRFNKEAESYFHLRAADFARSHFQGDQLSFHWYAKGAPLCLDWGYYSIPTHRPANMHNRTVVPGLSNDGRGEIVKTVFLPRVDYVHTRNGPGNERVRRVLYVRGDGPDDPEYALLRDSIGGAGEWNLWTMAKGVDMQVDGIDMQDFPTETREDYLQLMGENGTSGSELLRKNIAQLRLPFLPKAHSATLPLFVVPLQGRKVAYTGKFGVDLDVNILSDVDRVEMGADQWGSAYKGSVDSYFEEDTSRGEHQKLLRLHRDTPGDFLTLLYTRRHDTELPAEITDWGSDGVKISRTDGVRQYAWMSAPHWTVDTNDLPLRSFAAGPVKASAEALLLCDWPNGRHELVVIEGKECETDWVTMSSDEVATIVFVHDGERLTATSEGPKRMLRVTSPLLPKGTLVRVNGKPIVTTREGNTLIFSLPAGRCTIEFISNRDGL